MDKQELDRRAMEALDVVPANDAIHINLTRNGKHVFDESFHPQWTFSIFGDDEMIPGYKDLTIHLDFRANDLQPSVNIKYKQKMKAINEEMAELMDIEARLSDYFAEDVIKANGEESNGAANGSVGWTPPGKLHHSYQMDGRKFQIWVAPLTDPKARQILENMRILVPLFIEGGTIGFMDEPEWSIERWKLFLLYEVDGSDYTLAGFSTSYRVWVFPSRDVEKMATFSGSMPSKAPFNEEQETMPAYLSPLDLLSRERIAQFIILPPFQGQAHGSRLYNAMVALFRADNLCFEITVEEPNEQFDVLRDQNDMAYLLSQKAGFESLSLPSTIQLSDLARGSWVPDMASQDALFQLRAESKIAPRQFQRLTEIHLLSTLPARHRNTNRITKKSKAADEMDRKYYFWRLMVKERLFIRNKDQLMQVEEEERVKHLENTITGVVEEYEERIAQFEKRVRRGLNMVVEEFFGKKVKAEAGSNGTTETGKPATAGASKKRKKVVVEDDEEKDDGPMNKRMMGTGDGETTIGF